MDIGAFTFVPTSIDRSSGRQLDAGRAIHELLEQIELADEVGLDVFGIGEHHRPDYAVSRPAVVLAAAAARTRNIRLTSAVTVLSSDDPVRVFQEYATIDLISGGRAEIMAGRGSFTESFPLFGYDLDDYHELFSEKLDLLLKLRGLGDDELLEWEGRLRPPVRGRGVYPRPVQKPLPVWIAVGGTPQSVIRAGTLGLPLAVAIIGGEPARFKPLVDLYREAGERAGRDPRELRVSINAHGFVADTYEAARTAALPGMHEAMSRIGRERGWPPRPIQHLEAEAELRGALFLGTAEQVIEKILHQHEIFRHDRFMIQLNVGPVEHARVLRAIEILGTEVAPAIRGALSPEA